MPRLCVVDTNVLVSGVLRFEHDSAPARIVAAMVDGRLSFLLSADLLSEYRRVLLRPAIAARHGLGPAGVDTLIAALATGGYLRQPPGPAADASAGEEETDPSPHCPAGDEHVVALLAHEAWSALVSGDLALAQSVQGWRRMLTPAEAAAELGL